MTVFEYDEKLTENLEFTMLYPPEGESSIFEVSVEGNDPFLHVMLDTDRSLVFAFFPEKMVCLSEELMLSICNKAKAKLTLTDMSIFDEE